jgi:NADPH:quinone reductase-like Zn-dependent oxidoreductase
MDPSVTPSPAARDFEVRRDDLHRHRTVESSVPEPGEGDVVLHLDHAALTSNNITYGAFGEAMGYWRFFPADHGWGRVPVWGFADVVASRAEGIADGERVYGYFPMSTHLVVGAGRVTRTGFVDTAAHRAPLPPVYNQYQRIADRATAADEHLHAVLRPLFTTSFLIDDWLDEQSLFGARRVVVASASSKTGLALAALLHARGGVEVVGLTSARHTDFVSGVGYYDEVVTYGDVASIDATVPTVLVDMGGDAGVLAEVHGHLADALRHSCQVGATHWRDVRLGVELPGPRPAMFFAPDHVQQRVAEWGGAGFDERVGAAWDSFTASASGWLEIVEHRGPDEVAAAYEAVLDGALPARQAAVISLDDRPA